MTTKEAVEKTPDSTKPMKKPYEKPAFKYESVFVTTALSCGKVGPTSVACVSNTKTS
jgi:hypothetical protein